MKFFQGDRCNATLGGVCSIQLSYWDIYKFYAIFKARRNRTICRLGGPRYIHLTKETNAVFSSFFSLLATVAISMNPITKWWISIITYFDIQINPYWNRTLTYHFSTSVGVNHDWTLGVHPGTENSLHSTSIKVIQSLDFTAFSVNFRKDKKTCFHLRNYSLGGKMVDFPPLG